MNKNKGNEQKHKVKCVYATGFSFHKCLINQLQHIQTWLTMGSMTNSTNAKNKQISQLDQTFIVTVEHSEYRSG